MKTKYTYSIYFVFCLTLIVILIELLNAIQFRAVLAANMIGFSQSHTIYRLALQVKETYLESQIKGTNSRLGTVFADTVKTIYLIFVSMLFLNKKFQSYLLKIADRNISFVRSNFRELTRKEINFTCLFIGFYMLARIGLQLISKEELTRYFIIKISILGILGYFLVIPLVIYITYVLLQYFGKKIIVACYLAYIIKILPDVIINDTVNDEKMEQVDIDTFPDEIQNILRKYHLEDSVYKERIPGDEKNAALIGYGKGARMEIYGNFEESDKDELFSVFLHEIGHAKENTLLRKTVVYITLLFIELLIILFIYDSLSSKFVNDMISLFTAFVILSFIYRMLLRQWLIMIYKMVSQQSEINSDMFAKEHHYGKELAQTLFNIVLESSDYLRPTALYNFLRSGHPSISTRIDYLGQ